MSLFSTRPAHGDRIDLGGRTIRLRVDARARRVSLRVDQARREIVATAPNERRLSDALAFAREREGWIAAQLDDLPKAEALHHGQVIEIAGERCVLVAGPGRARLVREGGLRLIAPAGERFSAAVVRVLKAEARRILAERTQAHAQALGQPAPTVSVMDARGRWGSCTPARRGVFGAAAQVGRIRYSWRLVLAPYATLDYVAAHEAAHLVEANHGPKFWTLVRGLVGDERKHRAWLRAHGPALHAFGGSASPS